MGAICLLMAGCGPKTPSAPLHLAILRFENLSPDPSADWMGRALSEVISAELPQGMVVSSTRLHALDRTLAPRPVSAPGISSENAAAMLSGANRIGYGDYTIRAGRVEARLSLADPETLKTTRVLSTSAGDVLSAATNLARQISPLATAYDTHNSDALHDFTLALEALNVSDRQQDATSAIAADPNFGPAYRLLADARMQQRDRDGAVTALSQALAHGSSISAAERSRIEFEIATLRNDFAARQQALAAMAKTNPGDADSWLALAGAAYARHDYAQARDAYQRVLELRPDDINTLNQYGYAQAFAGDFDGAIRTLRRYQSLRPKDANSMDSQGDVNLMYGHLREAEALYLQADQKDRKLLGGGDLFKAAMARLMTGDVAGASALAKQFDDARAALHDPAVPIYQAEWLWISGSRKAAADQLQNVAEKQKDLAWRASLDLAIWNLDRGERTAAAQWAMRAQASAGQATLVDTIVARFISQPSASAAEWSARADQLFRNNPQSEAKDLTLAYALLLDKHFAEAATVLEHAYGGPSPEPGVPFLLAWSLVETGQYEKAAPLLRFNPVPQPTGVGPFGALYFPRLFDLRARLDAKTGRADEASANQKLFQLLSR